MPSPSQCDLICITFIKHKLIHYWRGLKARLHEAEARTPTRPRPRPRPAVTRLSPRPGFLASRPRPFRGLRFAMSFFLIVAGACSRSLHEFLVALLMSLCQLINYWQNYWMSTFDPLCSKQLMWWFTTFTPWIQQLFNKNISQGSGATHARCGGIFYYHFTMNLLMYLIVKESWKSVKIWVRYCRELVSLFSNTV